MAYDQDYQDMLNKREMGLVNALGGGGLPQALQAKQNLPDKAYDVTKPEEAVKLMDQQKDHKQANINLGVAAGTTAVQVGLAAYSANRQAQIQKRKEKEAAILGGMHAMSDAAQNKGMLDQSAFGKMMRIGR